MLDVIGSSAVLVAAFVAIATIVHAIAPQWRRILRLAAGHPEEAFAPLGELVRAEQRIAVRHWATDAGAVVRGRLTRA